MATTTEIQTKINAFKAIVEKSAISPKVLGVLLQDIFDALTSDDSVFGQAIEDIKADVNTNQGDINAHQKEYEEWRAKLAKSIALHHLEPIEDADLVKFYPKGINLDSGDQCSMTGIFSLPTVSDTQAGTISAETYKKLLAKQDAFTAGDGLILSNGELSVSGDVKKQLFIDLWNRACKVLSQVYGRYNQETGYFELNGLTDISYSEAITIFCAGVAPVAYPVCYFNHCWGRTNLPFYLADADYTKDTSRMFYYSSMEVIYNPQVLCERTYTGSSQLTKLLNPIRVVWKNTYAPFGNCAKLSDVTFEVTDRWLCDSLDLRACPNLSLATIQSFSSDASTGRTGGLTVYVDENIYSLLTTGKPSGSSLVPVNSADWKAAYLNAYQKNIIFACDSTKTTSEDE